MVLLGYKKAITEHLMLSDYFMVYHVDHSFIILDSIRYISFCVEVVALL